ncbi:MAG: right-handed parallel beta-helix repeat-containing protein [Terriglobales bacterium]
MIRFSSRSMFLPSFLMIAFGIVPICASAVPRQGRIWVVAKDNPHASDQNAGTAEEPFKTISQAALLAKPGDQVLVHAGVYRERVAPARGGEEGLPITYTAASGESVIVTGSEVLRGPFFAVDQRTSAYTAKLDPGVFPGENPYATHANGLAGRKTLGQIFVDGVPFLEVDDATQLRSIQSSWMATNGGRSLIIHFPRQMGNPNQHLVEYSVRDRVFAPYKRGLGYITVRGFTFEHCANPGLGSFWEANGHQAGMVSTRSGNHWIVEENVIRYAKSLGLDFGAEGGADQGPNSVSPGDDGNRVADGSVGWDLIQNNTIVDNGEAGTEGDGSHFVQIIDNTFERNNALGWTAVEEAAIKTHFFFNGLIEGNLFRDNNCPAVWIDNTYSHVRITRNVVLNSAEEGIFVELGFGPVLIDNNIVAYTRAGDGIYAHDSSGITVAHNLLLANADWGIFMRVVTDRKAFALNSSNHALALVETSNERIVENLIIDNYRGAVSLPPHWNRSRSNVSDFNVFAAGSQYQWGGGFDPVFAFDNCGGRIGPEELRRAVFKHLQSLPKDRWPSSGLWPEIELLTFDQWRAISGFEQHSVTARFKKPSSINGNSLMLSLTVEGFPWKMQNIPSVDEVARDFFDQPLSQQNPVPGPFQNLSQGENDLLLLSGAFAGKEGMKATREEVQ